MVNSPAEPARRVVIIGASNATRAFPRILPMLGQVWPEPLEIVTALGHGRSFGVRSLVLARALPGIVPCGLWETLARGPRLPTEALITDIGNDILYHVPVSQIADWVEETLRRLRGYEARIVVTRLPVAGLARLGAARFYFFRTVFMPLCRLGLTEVARRAVELDQRVAELAEQYGAATVTPREQWYGLDPLHITWSQMTPAWREILSHWRDEPIDWSARPRLRVLPWRWHTLAPHDRTLFGIRQRGAQPALQFNDGSRLSLF